MVAALARAPDAVGHRVVHGGARFSAPALVDAEVIAAIHALSPLAPLHNPAAAAGIEAVQSHLPPGHTTVGFEVHVKHFGATPKGKKVTVTAELTEVDGRKLRFNVVAHDEDKKVGEGTHRRAIIAVQPKK